MQEQLTASLAEKTIEVSVGGEKVTVTANGLGDIIGIKISKEVVDPEDGPVWRFEKRRPA